MEIVVSIDAGYRPLYRLAAYAVIIETGKQKYELRGLLKDCRHSDEAEFQAFLKAVNKLRHFLKKKHRVIIYTDSKFLELSFYGIKKFINNRYNAQVCRIAKQFGHLIDLRWIPRNSMMSQATCDYLCTTLLNSAEHALQLKRKSVLSKIGG